MRGLALTTILTVAVAGGAAATGGLDAIVGKAVFERVWVAAGASTGSADGLGPLHNARSCAGCHQGGGAARITVTQRGDLAGAGLVVRLADATGQGDPVYGDQIQTRGLPGQMAEAEVIFALAEAARDGEPGPRVVPRLEALAFGPVTAAAGVRRAPSLIGRAGFDTVDAAAILALADPDDADGDGISGRVHWVSDGAGGRAIGRYGWRATGATLDRQIAAALTVDLGLSTEAFPDPAGDCTPTQSACRDARHGGGDRGGPHEVAAPMTAALAAFLGDLRPRPPVDAPGATVFAAAGCAACHLPALPTVSGGTVPAFTDLLLHELGDGLSDPAVAGDAAPSEWRTAPIIGLVGHHPASRRYLHDGRASTLDEAVLWHGGEASAARASYQALSVADREALINYLESL